MRRVLAFSLLILMLILMQICWSNPRPEVEVFSINNYPPQIGLYCPFDSIDLSGMEIYTSCGSATVNPGIFGSHLDILILDSSNTSGFAFAPEGDYVQIPEYWANSSWGNVGKGSDGIRGHSLMIKPYYASYNSYGYFLAFDFTTLNQGFTKVIINELNSHCDWRVNSNFIELYNKSDSEVSLAGWKLVCDTVYDFPLSAKIKPHKFYIVDESRFPINFHLNNAHDNLYLINADSQIVDQVGWSSDHGANVSFMRYPDGNADSSSDMYDFWGYDDATSTSFSEGFPTRRAFNRPESPGLKVIGIEADTIEGGINISWTDPVWESVYSASILRKSLTGYPLDPYDGDLVYEGTDQQFLGDSVAPGQYAYYTVFARTGCGQYSTPDSESQISVFMPATGIDDKISAPRDIGNLNCYPNPFNGNATISYRLAESDKVKITIYNITGQIITGIDLGIQEPGEHRILWDGSACPSGVYFARLESSGSSLTKKLVLLK